MSDIAVMDVNPAGGVKSESPLAASKVRVATAANAAVAGVVVREEAFLGHLVLRGNSAAEGFAAGVERALGVPLPLKPCQLVVDAARGVSIQWSSPNEWLIIVPGGQEYATELYLREALSGHFAVVNISGAQTLITLSGPHAREVLMKSSPYDVDPAHFPVGKAVGTVFAKTTAVIRRPSEDEWQVIFRRSFADYLFRWTLDAAEEFGVFVAN
jgi:sarcosine oxidase subunit gamma